MTIKQSFYGLLLSLITTFSFAQDMSVKGKVYDTTGTKPLMNAVALAVRVKDSLMLGFQRTDEKGEFHLTGFAPDTFTLIISHPSYDDKFYYIFGHEGNAVIDIPTIAMPTKAQELDEVIIYAYKDPIYYKGDTLVYVADSFKVGENAVVEDLLKKLPGIEIDQDGKIKSQGQEIGQVLVDGDEFFGTDPTVATKNLGASGVQTVEVYEKKVENAGDGAETIQVLDLRLKDDAKKGYFGRISGGTDFDQFYEGELLVNKFNKTQKISVFVLGANTPKSDFGFGDRSKFGLENEGGGSRFDDDGVVVGFNDGSAAGIPQTLKAGVYFSDKIGKKKNTKIGFNYSYYNTRNDQLASSRSQYFIQDSSYFSDDSTRNKTFDESHRINLRFETKIDSLTTLEIRPSVTVNSASQENKDYSSWSDQGRELSRTNEVININASNALTFNNEIKLQRKYKKPKRETDLRYLIDYSENDALGNLFSSNLYEDSSVAAPLAPVDQQKINARNSQTHTGFVTHYEPLKGKFKLQLDYMYQYGINFQDKRTKDIDSLGDYSIENSIFTNNFRSLTTQNRVGTLLMYESRKHTITGGTRLRNIDIQNINLASDTIIKQNFNNVLPTLTYRYNPNQSLRMVVRYNTNSRQPAIGDLQPIPDNTNPNRNKEGNPNLTPDYAHNLNVNFNTYNALTGRYIYAGSSANLTQNGFGDSTTIEAFGAQTSKTINVDGNYYAVVYAGAGLPFFDRKFNFRPSLNTFLNRTKSFINQEENITMTRNIGFNFNYNIAFDSLEFDLRNSFGYNSPKNSLSSFVTKPFTTQEYFAGVKWRLPKGFKVESNVNYTINGQRADGYNINFLIWNAAISKSFLKTQNLEVSAIMNDILDNNINANRSVSQNIVTDNFTKIISRYFLVKTTYRFNNRKTTEKDEKGWF